MRARYLLRSLAMAWARDDDPAEVREILRGYAEKATEERRNVMEQLSKLADLQGLPALCRLARFETRTSCPSRPPCWCCARHWPPNRRGRRDSPSRSRGNWGPAAGLPCAGSTGW